MWGKLGASDMGMCSACAGASARACAKQHVDGMELVRGTLLARAAEALAVDQGDV